MKKKIIVIGNNSGGMYDFRGKLLSELIKRNNDVTVVTPFDTNVDDLKSIGVKLIRTEFNRRSINPINDWKLYKYYAKIVKKEKPDLIITYTIKPNIYGGYLASKMHIPYVANVTGLGTSFQTDGALKKLVIKMYKHSLKNAKIVFFENVENRDIFVNNSICDKEKTYVLNGAGVDIDYFYYSPYPLEQKVIRFLFVGRIMKEKGIKELFEAMSKLRGNNISCKLLVLGHFDDNKYAETVHQAEKSGWLQFFGYQTDVRPFIEQCHCFVLPSWHEGMANTNLECAAMGRPVITSNIHGCLEAVENGVSGFLCNKRDVDDLYEKMKEFISLSYEERKAMGIAGRKRMEEMFDKREIVTKTINRLFDKE